MNEKEKREWLDKQNKELKDEFLREINIKIPKEFKYRLFNCFDLVKGATVYDLARFLNFAPKEVQLEIKDIFYKTSKFNKELRYKKTQLRDNSDAERRR